MTSIPNLVLQLVRGDQRALSRLITIVEQGGPQAAKVLELVHPHAGKAYTIGITGPPGAGKSTLADGLIALYRKEGLSIGVLAVDPTSPLTGGAVLGDRIRMQRHALDRGVFIRSMATRGHAGGLSRMASATLKLLDASSKDILLLETVGVGQTELEVMSMADTVAVVLVPEAGDAVQVLKAGLLEIADIFVVNKADREGADRLFGDLEAMLNMAERPPRRGPIAAAHGEPVQPAHGEPVQPAHGEPVQPAHGEPVQPAHGEPVQPAHGEPVEPWRPPVLRTQAHRGEGLPELLDAIGRHRHALETSSQLKERRRLRHQRQFFKSIEEAVVQRLQTMLQQESDLASTLARVEQGLEDPYTAALGVLNNPAIPRRWLGQEPEDKGS